MRLSTLDLYTIGIGPSSSHTVGPMRAARRFAEEASDLKAEKIQVELYGSLAMTGKGHGTHFAIVAGLRGSAPETVDPVSLPTEFEKAVKDKSLALCGKQTIAFDPGTDLLFNRKTSLPYHPNGMKFTARSADGKSLLESVFYSVGGGFVVTEAETKKASQDAPETSFPFSTAEELIRWAETEGKAVSKIVLQNESAWREKTKTQARLDKVWQAMQACVEQGLNQDGVLPGGMKVPRRAPAMYRNLRDRPESALKDSLTILDWVDLYAIAVNEENAAGGRVVTAPTNGAAGIIPAVMHYCDRFLSNKDQKWHRNFLLTAGAIGVLFKENASISGADVGCQGEVGVACSMAAGALAEFMGGTPRQVENAAEIGMEHNLGLTCDPIGGLVQIPCIERNAMGAVKAINAARIALRGDGRHTVSLDAVIKTMRDTGKDMRRKYKETSRGGLAVNVVEC
ncbi:L-serine ammonia-lyase [Puniceicoccales bacterium CK1056]|uniref:L-serine dehydratase n=1 Tax=Oceanipulchritudo coccoides TaxID=2706888 RepID=A0A6B2LZL2_9BACT|nr:L-serine ammonia-lyase [Oceanipulchritudo coccoides]NDV60960.1 L-serine ammonia-lyase [Oceanipulchritudo coccoides]